MEIMDIINTNTGDGTNNITNQTKLSSAPSAINIRNKYFTEIMIQKNSVMGNCKTITISTCPPEDSCEACKEITKISMY